jgi:hypothetical protein
MESIDRKRAFSAPESEFRIPHAVVESRELSDDDKMVVLRNWKQELIQLQKANEENMLNGGGQNDLATRLAAVTQAMTELKRTRH